ncbi:MAG: sigma-54 interaction domain-containing protein [Desulfurispora sp.]|uniref:sigma-54 interaction domain-containing protein n=1 Tax=Desulfurispora sp. TaxID=3014275 RepID=UPI0040494B28
MDYIPCPPEIAEIIAENDYEAIIFVDQSGIIRWINKGYTDFIQLTQQDCIGRFVKDIFPQSKLLEVMQSGKPQYGDFWELGGQQLIVHRWPIYRNGELVGCLGKSVFRDQLELAKKFVHRLQKLEKELHGYRNALARESRAKYTTEQIIGRSEKIARLRAKILRIARTTSTVLITGESGTGKELIAHAIHNASDRSHMPFVRVNCTTIPEELLESELFGYEEGAFTGARKGGKLGKFELAQGGTIFLDEIGDISRTMQAKLLRVLQEREIERVGGTHSISVNVRVIAATNRNLEEMIRHQLFREDLYYRLNVVLLQPPPLRERKEDIPLLAEHLLRKICHRLATPEKTLRPEVIGLFQNYDWPGNVRELENMLEQAVNLSDAAVLTPLDFPALLRRISLRNRKEQRPLAEALATAEKDILVNTLLQTGNNKKEAARLLGIHRSVLYRKLARYNLL